ncbi:MAG: 50S ribosomal protein L4 [Alphaproteobacteria bacterium]|jgi:large subunit ribosomal protein L4|nr:50S ribosomal protein L4 [Rhodospirillaceae bacterium]MBT6205574.1 50S ribosomal protein L4 [Rhodospirillaceae bacterium]MBT6508840.1 50S ribosomal protein L4 [Rhodospirillaceae bacterium]MBT7614702.1 50S ribosomal protein L4 [Rhodospirillaceae bacterium]MDG2482850.1 50S ribosomal protein L4 [Alphaproteobacteria bacterium]
MKTDVLTLDNKKAGSVDLSEDVFGLPARPDILARVINWQLAKRRAGTHSTKSTSDVVGTTHRVGRQKGGGTARHGSRKTNIFRGGAIGHGPVQRSHAFKLPKKIRALGLKTALSVKQAEGKLLIVENADLEGPKTKELVARLGAMGIGNALFVDGAAVNENFLRAVSNIPGIDVLPSAGANVYDIVRRDTLVLTKDAVTALEERLK